MIVKVKEPQPAEWVQLREGQLLYTYLHLAPDPEQTKGLLASGVTAIAYETVTDDRGGLPLLAPMSEVAGRLSIQAGATALQKANGGLGILLGGVPGVLPAKVTIIGGGVVGLHAARMAAGPVPMYPFWIAHCRVCASSTIYSAVVFIPAIPVFRRLKMKSSLPISSSAPY